MNHRLPAPGPGLAGEPFSALPGEVEGSYLIEEHSFVYLQSASALPAHSSDRPFGRGALLVGGVEYGASSGPGRSWPALPGTPREIARLRGSYEDAGLDLEQLEILEAAEATEARFKAEVEGRRYVHLATHGFFKPTGFQAAFDSLRSSPEPRDLTELERELEGLMPGLLSGVLLAGANRPAVEDGEDARLTAQEVAWLPLDGCELVVLSACDTALGTVASGENLIGLRRAFHLAGVQATISSCWKIPDEQTGELMGRFYELHWGEGLGKLEALRTAQLEMLRDSRAREGRGRPDTWGAFVLEGV